MAVNEAAFEPEFKIKHRIAGAVILIAVAVFILPLVLKPDQMAGRATAPVSELRQFQSESNEFVSQIRPMSESTTRVTKPGNSDESSAQSHALDASIEQDGIQTRQTQSADWSSGKWPGNEVPGKQDKSVKAGAQEAQSGVKTKTQTPGAATGAAKVAKKAPKAAPKAARSDIEPGWVVQVGTFSKKENAVTFLAEVRKKGYAADTSPAVSRGKKVTRVWVGPFERRVDAAKARQSVREKLNVKGFITPYP